MDVQTVQLAAFPLSAGQLHPSRAGIDVRADVLPRSVGHLQERPDRLAQKHIPAQVPAQPLPQQQRTDRWHVQRHGRYCTARLASSSRQQADQTAKAPSALHADPVERVAQSDRPNHRRRRGASVLPQTARPYR